MSVPVSQQLPGCWAISTCTSIEVLDWILWKGFFHILCRVRIGWTPDCHHLSGMYSSASIEPIRRLETQCPTSPIDTLFSSLKSRPGSWRSFLKPGFCQSLNDLHILRGDNVVNIYLAAEKISIGLIKRLVDKSPICPVTFVGHSLGGLVMTKFACNSHICLHQNLQM